MKNTRTPLIIMFLVSLISFTGCEKRSDYSIETPQEGIFSQSKNLYNNGLIYINGNMAKFLEYKTLTDTVLCNKPNCNHKSGDCIAQIATNSGGGSTPPIVYNDNVYFFTSVENIVDSEDGRSSSFDIQCKLHKINLHTGESKIVCTFTGMESRTSSNVFLKDEILYFIANNGSIQTSSGAWYYFSTAGLQYFCSINLENGEYKNYGQINDNEKAHSTLFTKGESAFGINGNVSLAGIYDNKIWLYYYYTDSAETLYQILSNTGEVPDISDPIFHRENITFDLSSKKLEKSLQPDSACIGDGYYIYWNSNKKQYIAKQIDKEEPLQDFPKTNTLQIYNNIVWDLDTGLCFNLKTGVMSELSDKYKTKKIEILGIINDRFIIQFYESDSDKTTFEIVSEADLIKY